MMKDMTPVKLRLILSVTLLLLAILGTGLFMFGYSKVDEFAKQAQETATQASTSNNSLQDLIATKKTLETNSEVIDRAAKLAAESQSYIYQDQIIQDINQFAAEAQLSVANITFTEATTTATAATPAPAATTDVTGGGATATTPTGIKSMTATVSLKNPIDYNKMLTFLNLIEQSLFRMQVSQIGLSKATGDGGANDVTSDTLTIEVYIR